MNDDEIIDRLRTRYGRNRTLPRADAERILDAVCRAGLRIVKSEIGPPPSITVTPEMWEKIAPLMNNPEVKP